MAEQDFSEIAKLSERYNKDPKSRIFVQLADAYRKNNMIDESLEILNKGLEHHPNYALAYLILGKCYIDKRMYAQAKESFEKTLSFDPQNVVALRMLAQTCESMKDEEGQIAAYKAILALDPFDASAKEKLAHLESLQKKEPLYTVSMAQEYEKQGNIAKALSIYENLLFTDPTDLVLQQKVKELKENLGKEKKTLEEEKIEGLQVETYYQPEQLETKTEPTTPTPETAGTISQAPGTQPPKTEESVPEAEAPTPSSGEEELKPEQKDEQILPLEDFLTVKPVEQEPAATPPQADALDILKPSEPAEEPTPEPMPEEKPIPEPADALDILKPMEPAEEPTPEPTPAEKIEAPQPVQETPAQPPEPEIKEEKLGEKKEEPSKPKEEDFKSFQDWLSGLLK